MNNNTFTVDGPLLGDKEFFDTLNIEAYPELAACGEAIARGDGEEARRVFAKCAREIPDPEKFFSLPSREALPTLTAGLKEKAERALRHEMVSCGTPMKFEGKVDWFANPTFNQYKEWPWQLSRHDELVGLARAYRATGDARYAAGCAELLDSWIKQAVRPEYTEGSGATFAWRTIECGIRMGLMWPEIIHTFYATPEFTDDLIFDFYKSVYEHSLRMINGFTNGNWLMHELNGLAQSGIFYPIFKDSAEWVRIAMDRIEKELTEIQVYPDGFQYENSTGYHSVVITHVMEIVDIAEVYGVPVPQSIYDAIENMLMLYVKLMQANGKMPHPNDGGGGDCTGIIRHYIRCFPRNEYFKWVVSGGKDGKKPDFGSILLEYCGMITLRNADWSRDTSAFFDAGVFGHAHQHEDKLNLTICNSSKPVLCEANTYAYDTSDERRYCVASEGHNVILVNGLGQSRRAGYRWSPEMIRKKAEDVSLTITPEADVATGVYDDGFGPEKEKLARHERKVIMLKKPKKGLPLYIAVDRLTSERDNEYEAIWHFDTANAAVNGKKFVSDDISVFICGDVGEIELVSGRREPNLQGWIFRRSIQGSAEPIPTLLHRIHARNAVTVNVFSIHGENGSAVEAVELDGAMLTVRYIGGGEDNISLL